MGKEEISMNIERQYLQVINLFQNYLDQHKSIWIMKKHAEPIYYVMEAQNKRQDIFEELALCKIPEELFDCLLDHLITAYYDENMQGDSGYIGDTETDILYAGLSAGEKKTLEGIVAELKRRFEECRRQTT